MFESGSPEDGAYRGAGAATEGSPGGAIDDAAIVRRIAGGDLRASGELYDRYASTLLAIGLRILRDRAEAEDAVHDAFVQMAARASLYTTERGSVVAWLITMTRNLCIDRVRKAGRRRELIHESMQHEPATVELPAAASIDTGTREAIRRTFAALSEEQRETLEEIFYEGKSMPEIAAEQGVPLGTIKSRVARALTKLRTAASRMEKRRPRSP